MPSRRRTVIGRGSFGASRPRDEHGREVRGALEDLGFRVQLYVDPVHFSSGVMKHTSSLGI